MKMKPLLLAACLLPAISFANPQIVISKSSQSYQLLVDGKVIKTGKVSTGKPGHTTPSGSFSIRSKFRMVRSMKYKAPMPNAMFFIGNKYAIHAGRLPGYPASHGCVRISRGDSQHLFSILRVGSTVIIE